MREILYGYTAEIGKLTLASDGESITGLWIDGQKYDRATLESNMKTARTQERPVLTVFEYAKEWLDVYFSGQEPETCLPLRPRGSAFRQDVWKILCEIPYGETITYGAIAGKIAERYGKSSMSAQAVGGAIGHNPISILIPCHRVLGSDGSLTGYAGGVEVKKRLLELEQKGKKCKGECMK